MNRDRPASYVTGVLKAASVRRIVLIDDRYGAQDEDLVPRAAAMAEVGGEEREILVRALDAIEIPFEGPWREDLERALGESDETASKFAELLTPPPDEALSAFRRLVSDGDGIEVIELTPAAWLEQRDDVLAGANSDNRVLCLFDLDLRLAGRSATGGAELLRQVSDASAPESVYLGILSSTVSTGNEQSKHTELAAEHEIDPDRFIVIAKSRTDSPEELGPALKVALMLAAFSTLRRVAQEVRAAAAVAASEQIDAMSIVDFEQIVFKSTLTEGVWEIDTLLRVAGILERRERLTAAYRRRSTIDPAVAMVRALEEVKMPIVESPTPWVWSLSHSELHDEPELVNQFLLPVDLGDWFEAADGQLWLLLDNRCDVILRRDGKRRLQAGTLVGIASYDEPPKRPSNYAPQLEYFPEADDGRFWCVEFRRTAWVTYDVLDLVATNVDGVARLEMSAEIPPTMHGPLAARLRKLIDRWTAPATTEGMSVGDISLTLTNTDHSVSTNFRRRGRVLSSVSADLLSQQSQFRNRSARPHDLRRNAD